MKDTFGKRLKRLRSAKGKQQKEVALDLEISKGTYFLYESDLRMPGIKTLIRIADYYNVSLDYLVGRDHRLTLDNDKLYNDLEKTKLYISAIQNYIKNFK